ncbi:Nucleoid-associated protein [bioreactor metagenome]|uniref:Nucleoid-associated protein n=1 Tax=bioreactor metagenome TaxID=1076179 RepID=A0A644XJQ6_9ZZZZ
MAKGFGRPGMGGAGGGMGGGLNMNMIKQAQKMQQDMARLQAELEAKEYTAQAGGGMVSATVSGKRELSALVINPEAVDPDDVEMLQDMIMAAVNEAVRTAVDDATMTMQQLTGGLNLPF